VGRRGKLSTWLPRQKLAEERTTRNEIEERPKEESGKIRRLENKKMKYRKRKKESKKEAKKTGEMNRKRK